jgi:glutathione synthase/RimK-type ligase-like ATP-grasp enzyme
MKILITCPRAPVSIEWAKIALKNNHNVIFVDSLEYPIGKFLSNTEYKLIPSPRIDFKNYEKEMLTLLNSVDMVIPNCEDIFFLSKVKQNNTDLSCHFFMPDSTLLFKLHNKYEFFECLNEHIAIPKTHLLTTKEEIDFNSKSILKPVYSRFGASVIREVTKQSTKDITIDDSYPWVQQEYIKGQAVCNYAICEYGKVIAHVVYRPKYLLNQAAATYFEYIEDKRCDKFIEQFAKENNYHGQVAFDFIDDGEKLYIIECNPRATSGLHLLSSSVTINDYLSITQNNTINKNSYSVGVSLFVFFGLKALKKKEFKKLIYDYKKSKNVLDNIPWYAQFFSLYEMIKRVFIYKKPLTRASTFDIEYDGEENG